MNLDTHGKGWEDIKKIRRNALTTNRALQCPGYKMIKPAPKTQL